MRTKHLFKLISILFLCLVFSMNYAQSEELSKKNTERIASLEEQMKNIEKKFDIEAKGLEIKAEKVRNELKSDYDQLEQFTYIVGTVTLLGAIISIISFYFVFSRKILKIAEQKAKEKFENLFEDEKDRLIELIEKKIEENQLRKSKSILVLTPAGSKTSFLKKFFREMKIPNVKFQKIDEDKIVLDESDLILFNDEDKEFKENIILDFISKTKKDVICFYFGPKRINSGEYNYKTTFANARVQLYGNLINALRYQKLL